MKIAQIGWVIAAALAGTLIASGFQGTAAQKVGVVDMSKVFSESEYAKKQTEQLKAVGSARQAVLEFVQTYTPFTAEQAVKFHDLSIKENATSSDKSELDRIKSEVQASDKQLKDLQTKQNPSPAEQTQLTELTQRSQSMAATSQRWAREFDEEVHSLQDKLRNDTLERVRKAIADVGAKQAYTLIYASDFAPYGANDVTADALKAMNAAK